jgi:hypothetical protein
MLDRIKLAPRESQIAHALLVGAVGIDAIEAVRGHLTQALPSLLGVGHSVVVQEGVVLAAVAYRCEIDRYNHEQPIDGLDLAGISSELIWVISDFMPTMRCQRSWPDGVMFYGSLLTHFRKERPEPQVLGSWFMKACQCSISNAEVERAAGKILEPLIEHRKSRCRAAIEMYARQLSGVPKASELGWPPSPPRTPMWLRDLFFLG